MAYEGNRLLHQVLKDAALSCEPPVNEGMDLSIKAAEEGWQGYVKSIIGLEDLLTMTQNSNIRYGASVPQFQRLMGL